MFAAPTRVGNPKKLSPRTAAAASLAASQAEQGLGSASTLVDKTSCPAAQHQSVQAVPSTANRASLRMAGSDVDNAYVMSALPDTLYMRQPPGRDDGTVCVPWLHTAVPTVDACLVALEPEHEEGHRGDG